MSASCPLPVMQGDYQLSRMLMTKSEIQAIDWSRVQERKGG